MDSTEEPRKGGVQFSVQEQLSLRRMMDLTYAQTFDGARNAWLSCGYPGAVTIEEMELRYKRMGMPQTIVDAYPVSCWSKAPEVYETDKEDLTPFEKKWNALIGDENLRLLETLKDVDRLAGRGKHAALLIGFDDGKSVELPVSGASKVIFVKAFHPSRVYVLEHERDIKNPRYGRPTKYDLHKNLEDDTDTLHVHWSRIVHVADCTDDIDWIGEHRLQRVYNYLIDLEKIVAGAAEMFWKGGFPGLGLSLDKELNPDATQKAEMDQQVTDYFNGLTRALRLRGVTSTQFQTQVADPTAHFQMCCSTISSITRIPVKVLMGADLSPEDMNVWLSLVQDRRISFCQPRILLPFIRQCQSAGALPALDEVKIEWPVLKVQNDKEDADIARVRTDALARYASTPGMEMVMSIYHYLTVVMRLSEKQAQEIIATAAKAYGGSEEGLMKALTELKKAAVMLKGGVGSGGLGTGADRLPESGAAQAVKPADATRRNDGRSVK